MLRPPIRPAAGVCRSLQVGRRGRRFGRVRATVQSGSRFLHQAQRSALCLLALTSEPAKANVPPIANRTNAAPERLRGGSQHPPNSQRTNDENMATIQGNELLGLRHGCLTFVQVEHLRRSFQCQRWRPLRSGRLFSFSMYAISSAAPRRSVSTSACFRRTSRHSGQRVLRRGSVHGRRRSCSCRPGMV